ncbi:MAG TPA: YihY/virulence factor BrkB family protein [Vicinamibacteria bacterium]|nr:YihY/virulence factor BrkB family protein [Vicinamibacteria bacterium]
MIATAVRVAWRALVRFFDHNGPDRAAAVAYYTLLSLLPLLIFVISLGVAVLGSFDAAYQSTLFLMRGVVVQLDERTLQSLRQFVERASELTWPGILILAWTSKRTFASLFSALDRVFEVEGQGFLRGLARGNLAPFAMVLVTGVGLLASLFLALVMAAVEGFVLRLGSMGNAFHSFRIFVLTQALPVFVTLTFFFIVYRFVPHRTLRARHALAGAVLATMLWELAKAGFAWYLKNLAHYAGLYGTLEGIIVLALWLEVSVSIILYCGEVVALLIEPTKNPGTGAP